MHLRKQFKRPGKPATAVIVAALAIILLAAWGGRLRQNQLLAHYPPPGQMVDIGGYRLHLHCQGSGAPTVIVETGLGGPGLSWAHIQEALAPTSRVCVYDRAGLGWSEPGPTPRTAVTMAAELHTLLSNAAVPAPYLLVGYSSGGVTARLFAYEHPELVAGLVLVDSAHGEQMVRLKTDARLAALIPRLFGLLPLLARSGLPALAPSLLPLPGKGQLPADTYATYQALMAADMDFTATLHDEMQAVPENLALMRTVDRPGALADLPLLVVAHSQAAGTGSASQLPGQNQAAAQIFHEMQNELAALSGNGRVQFAYNSAHDVPYRRPDVIIEAVQEVIMAVMRDS